jgi:hypothetical protein
VSNVEIVQYFNGEEQRVRRTARTNSGARRGIRACANGNGWGVKLRGTEDALKAIGAEQDPTYRQWYFIADPKTDRLVDCEVVK